MSLATPGEAMWQFASGARRRWCVQGAASRRLTRPARTPHAGDAAGGTSSLSLRPAGRARVRKQPRRANLAPLGAPRRRAPGERGRHNSDEDGDEDDGFDDDVDVAVDLADDVENAPPPAPTPTLRAPWSADWDSWQLGGRQVRAVFRRPKPRARVCFGLL
jgi:hypothetical protein